jgi:hypothetical protein
MAKAAESADQNTGTSLNRHKMVFGVDKCRALSIRRGKVELEGFERRQGNTV